MSAIRLVIFFVLSSFICAIAAAAEAPFADPKFDYVKRGDGFTYAVPKSGPLRFKKFEDEGARFSGQIRLTGKYVYGHTDSDPASEVDAEPQLYFLPDDATRAQLPYWYDRGVVNVLYIKNDKDFLRAVVAPDLVARVRQRKVRQVTGDAAIWVDDYFATAECDNPEYLVHFIRVDRPPQLLARNQFAEALGCG